MFQSKRSSRLYFRLLGMMAAFVMLSVPAQAEISEVSSFRGGGAGKLSFSVPFSYEFLKFVIADDKLFTSLIPGMTRWEVISSTPTSHTAICTMSTSRLIPPVTYTARVDRVSDHELHFKRIKGDLKRLEGTWTIQPSQMPGRSWVNYSYSFDTGLGFIPSGVAASEIQKHLMATELKVNQTLPKILSANSMKFHQKMASSIP